MSSIPGSFDLLTPAESLTRHYVHQLRQTIQAYSATQIVVGEALQNAIDAVVQAARPASEIQVHLDFDNRQVQVRDSGDGFPNQPQLLFLGGTEKRTQQKKIFGLVGVGLKVVLFSSSSFRLRSKFVDGTAFYECMDAYKFDQEPPPPLTAPMQFQPDPSPLDSAGTELTYSFPTGTSRDLMQEFLRDVIERCLPHGLDRDFSKAVSLAVGQKVFDNRLSAVLSAYFRRFTYSGDVLTLLDAKPELKDCKIILTYKCSNPDSGIPMLSELLNGANSGKAEITPSYLLSDEVARWLPIHERPGLFNHDLGAGGENLTRTFKGINKRQYVGAEDYEKLVTSRKGALPEAIQEYRDRLFGRINGIVLTIGRIGLLEELLPGGSRRILSCNGVTTSHELDLTRGRNQEYVRCFDIVIDVDGTLNYGKSQITDNHLVSRVRRFLNDAYAATIQNAAGNWVGRVDPPDQSEERDIFVARPDLGLPGYILQKTPRDENDVIALFFELGGHAVLKGYFIYGLSQKDQYDSRGVIRRSGDKADPPPAKDDRAALTIEFKVEAAAVIGDFERESKNPREIHLLIAWTEGKTPSQQFGFADIQHSRHFPNGVFPGVKRYLLDTKSGAEVQVLELDRIVESLKKGESIDSLPAAAAKPASTKKKK